MTGNQGLQGHQGIIGLKVLCVTSEYFNLIISHRNIITFGISVKYANF